MNPEHFAAIFIASREELTESKNRTTLYIVYMQELYVEMKAHGLDPPPLPEE